MPANTTKTIEIVPLLIDSHQSICGMAYVRYRTNQIILHICHIFILFPAFLCCNQLLHIKPKLSLEQCMLFDTIPRGSLAATLTVADMVGRMNSRSDITPELRHAVAVVSCRLLDPNQQTEPDELIRCTNLVALMYLG